MAKNKNATESQQLKKDGREALAASRFAAAVGAKKIADTNRRDAAELNALARQAAKEGR